jgi:tripartite-type tricarboxylate transporter receptor subunit TctC
MAFGAMAAGGLGGLPGALGAGITNHLANTYGNAMMAAATIAAATVCAQAQSYPDKPIHIISGTQVGTSGDLAGRMLAQKLTAQIGQPVVFESRPGANGQIAANYLKTLPPDGYNILYTASSTVVTGPLMSKSVGFDTFKDFTPISQAVGAPLYLVATEPDTTKSVGQRVARLPRPTLDEGPHMSYALQWFAFAAIALIGGAAVALRGRTL